MELNPAKNLNVPSRGIALRASTLSAQASQCLDFRFVGPRVEQPADPTHIFDLQKREMINLSCFELLKACGQLLGQQQKTNTGNKRNQGERYIKKDIQEYILKQGKVTD